jgi:hypothetical protein
MANPIERINESSKVFLDWAAVTTALGALAGALPALAALAALIWHILRIYESRTVQKWLHRKDPNFKPECSDKPEE